MKLEVVNLLTHLSLRCYSKSIKTRAYIDWTVAIVKHLQLYLQYYIRN
jgi:hypothetical protein